MLKKLNRALGLAIPLALASTCGANAVPFTIEGYLQLITAPSGGLPGSAKCGEQSFQIKTTQITTAFATGTVIRTPTMRLTAAQLWGQPQTPAQPQSNFAPLSGFSETTGAARFGFNGGHCVVTGDTADVGGTAANPIAREVLIDLSEAVLLGDPLLTNGVLTMAGVEVVPDMSDYRMSAAHPAVGLWKMTSTATTGKEVPSTVVETITNNEGFGLDMAATAAAGLGVGPVGAASGYWGTDNKLYAFSTIVDGRIANPATRASISKVTFALAGAGNDSFKVTGGCLFSSGTAAAVSFDYKIGPDAPWVAVSTGTATCTPFVPALPQVAITGRYTAILSGLTFGTGAVPYAIRARLSAVNGVAQTVTINTLYDVFYF